MRPRVATSSDFTGLDALEVRGRAGATQVSIVGRRRKQIGGYEIGVLWVEHGVVAAGDVR